MYVTGENLLTFTSLIKAFDPETLNNMTYPINKKIAVGLNLTFWCVTITNNNDLWNLKNYIALALLAGMAAACDYTDLSPLDSFTDQKLLEIFQRPQTLCQTDFMDCSAAPRLR